MTLDNNVKTSGHLKSDYSNSSINDSIFFNSSISIDVCVPDSRDSCAVVNRPVPQAYQTDCFTGGRSYNHSPSFKEIKGLLRRKLLLNSTLTRRSYSPEFFFNLKPLYFFSICTKRKFQPFFLLNVLS